MWSEIRALFEQSGFVFEHGPVPKCSCLYDSIFDQIKIPYMKINDTIYFEGTNCIDFLGKLYEDKKGTQYEKFKKWLGEYPPCYVYKTCEGAIFPTKAKTSDVGYDLSIIKPEKEFMNNVVLYDTGLKINVKYGYYAEVVPRSSLSKSGYMLANSIGIIDNSYRGNLYIALVKINPEAPEIIFPFKCCQLIFRKQVHVDLIETSEDFNETARNQGGFGSSD